MARKSLEDLLNAFGSFDPRLAEELEKEMASLIKSKLPGDIDKQRLVEIIEDYSGCIYFMDEIAVQTLCKAKTVEKSRAMLASGKLIERSFNGDEITGVVTDLNHIYNPSVSFDFTDMACDCSEPSTRLCSHITMLLLVWVQDKFEFLPVNPSPDQQQAMMDSEFGAFMIDVTGEHDYTRALAKLKMPLTPSQSIPHLPTALLPAPQSPTVAAPAMLSPAAQLLEGTKISSGKVNWPTAAVRYAAAPPLKQTVEAEFNATQLRELAKSYGIKLKGTSKSAFVDQVVAEMMSRVERMRQTPDLLLEGLTDDQASLVRRMMTARDYSMPFPRNLVNNLWSQLTNRDPDKHANDALDALRRKAILFPTRNHVGYRDVYYQWLPLDPSGGNCPLMQWPARQLLAKNKPGRSSQQSESENKPNFLDAFELFIGALMSSGTEVRASLPQHAKTDSVLWLQHWEHHMDEVERVINSRPGWVPNPSSGISIPLLSPLAPQALVVLQGQTGLSSAQCEFLFGIAAALQLVEAPDTAPIKGRGKLTNTPWKIGARVSTIEEWFALADEVKLILAWDAWRQLFLFGFEATRAANFNRKPTDGQHFNVMRSIGAHEFLPTDLAAEWASLRRYVTRVLSGLPKNEWISWPELRKQMFEFYPDCQWTIFGQEQWWFNAPGKPTRLEINRYDNWQYTVGAVIENIIAEPLRWFGVVEVDAGSNGLEAFRVTELLAWLTEAQVVSAISSTEAGAPANLARLPVSTQPRPRQIEPVRWLSDSRWHLPPAPDRAGFITFARLIADATDAPFTYVLTPASIERAIAAGITLDEVGRQFEQIGAPMPAAARELYTSIAERFGRVRLYESLTLLQLADDYALRELLSSTSLGQHVIYQISPRAVVVKAEAVDRLVNELIAKGYTPGVK